MSLLQVAAIVAFAWALASLVTGFIGGIRMPQAWPLLVVLVVAASARGLAAWLWDLAGSAGAMRVKAELRREILVTLERHPAGLRAFPTARIATLLGSGLDALDEYFGRYLPQLVLTVIATPLLIGAAWGPDRDLTLALPGFAVSQAREESICPWVRGFTSGSSGYLDEVASAEPSPNNWVEDKLDDAKDRLGSD